MKARAQAAIRGGDFTTALRFAREAAAIGADTGGRGLLAGSLCEAAVALTGLQRHLEAFETLQQARELIAETADTLLAVSWLQAYARLMRAWGKTSQAVPLFEEGLRELQGRVPQQSMESLHAELASLRSG